MQAQHWSPEKLGWGILGSGEMGYLMSFSAVKNRPYASDVMALLSTRGYDAGLGDHGLALDIDQFDHWTSSRHGNLFPPTITCQIEDE